MRRKKEPVVDESALRTKQNLKFLVKSSTIMFLSIAFSKIFTYLYRVYIAREFGPEAFGFFSLGLMVLGIAIAITGWGIADGLVRFISYYRGKKSEQKIAFLIRLAFMLLTFTGIFGGIIVYLASPWIAIEIFHNENIISYLRIFSICIPISLVSSIYLAVLRAYEQVSTYSFLFNVFQNFTRVLALFILVTLGVGNAIPISHAIGITSMLVGGWIACRKIIPQVKEKGTSEKERIDLKKELFGYSNFVLFTTVVSLSFSWIDSFFIGYYQNATAVGIYSSAFSIAAILTLVHELFMLLFLPMITKEYSQKNYKVIQELSKQVSKWIFIINLPLLILILVYPGVLINLIFGSEYLAGENALRIIAVGIFSLSVLYTVSSNIISMMGVSRLLLINNVIASIVNVALNILLVPRYGITGAAVATSLSMILLSVLSAGQVFVRLKFVPLRRKMISIGLLSLIPLLALIIFRSSLPRVGYFGMAIGGILFFTLYVVLIILSRSLDHNDHMIISTFWRKIRMFEGIRRVFPYQDKKEL